ncbi:MAG: flagellar export protein FliJ [Ruminococcaceae bacterium]|nr:flagellar export protein FliJ [Oscillospiraceae bacterium]
MKKFKFTLESLKKYNEQILDSEKNTLGRLRAEYSDMQKALEAKELEYEQAIEKLEELMTSGTNVMRVSLHKRYIASLQQDMYRIKAEMAAKDEEIQHQLQKVVDATKEVSKIEKLEEKQIEQYKYEEQKESELFIEEFVSNGTFREN